MRTCARVGWGWAVGPGRGTLGLGMVEAWLRAARDARNRRGGRAATCSGERRVGADRHRRRWVVTLVVPVSATANDAVVAAFQIERACSR